MPEASVPLAPRRVSSPRILATLRTFAVALCATAFLLPMAEAGKRPAAASAKKATASAESKQRGSKVAATSSSKVASKAGAEKSARAAGGKRSSLKAEREDRRVVAKLRGKKGSKIEVAQRRSIVRVVEAPPPRLSFGQMAGLHNTVDALDLKSSVALVMDQDTREVLFSKNSDAVLPIASITKLMTALVVTEAKLPLNETLSISDDDVDTEKGSRSRLTVGTTLPRGELLHLALMSSENRAAHALGRTYPGGLATFVSVMNAKARQLGMKDTRYVEPTGLSSRNQSSAQDLALLVNAAYADPMVRQLSVSPEHQVEVGNRVLQFNTTNRLVRSPEWDIGLQKTGYISEAGQCLVMQAKVAGRKLIMVFLDSAGKLGRINDAERVRRWVEATQYMVPAGGTVHAVHVAG